MVLYHSSVTAKKKIVFLTRPISPPWDEASKNFAMYLARAINIPGVELTLLTTKHKVTVFPSWVKQEHIQENVALSAPSKMRLVWYILKTDADCIHSLFVHTPLTGFIIRLIKSFKNFKAIQTISSLSSRRLVPLTLFGDVIVCFSRTNANLLKQHNVASIVIPPAVPTDIFVPSKKENIIAFLGELYRLKSYPLVDGLVELLTENMPDYRFVLGFRRTRKPPQEQYLMSQLKEKWQRNPRISFVDVIEDMPSFLSKTKLVVLPATQFKGKFDYPLVARAALASGTPVILSRIGPMKELASFPGVVAPTINTSQCFFEVIVKSLKTYHKLSDSARKTAQAHFSIETIAKQYEALYQKILF